MFDGNSLVSNGVFEGHNIGATKQPGEPDGYLDYYSASTWYTWVSPAIFSESSPNSAVTFDTTVIRPVPFDTVVDLFTLPAGETDIAALTFVTGNDDCVGFRSCVTLNGFSPNTVYYIRVSSFGDYDRGNFYMRWVLSTCLPFARLSETFTLLTAVLVPESGRSE